jgi:hypothetical protein
MATNHQFMFSVAAYFQREGSLRRVTVSNTWGMTDSLLEEGSTRAPSKTSSSKIPTGKIPKGAFRVEAHPNETSYLSRHTVTAGQPSSRPRARQGCSCSYRTIQTSLLEEIDSSCIYRISLATPPALEFLSVGPMAERNGCLHRALSHRLRDLARGQFQREGWRVCDTASLDNAQIWVKRTSSRQTRITGERK